MPIIEVKKNHDNIFNLDKDVFELLFNHTIARRKAKFICALTSNAIQYDDFIKLSRTAEVPYPLFFLEKNVIKKIIAEYEKLVYFGVCKDQLAIASRGDINLADISLILKDITRKQNFLKKYMNNKNSISGIYKRTRMNIVEQAQAMRDLLGYDIDKIEKLSKEKTFNFLDYGLANNNVFISLYAHHYTPQEIDKSLQFSGIAINDKKCPFLFIKAGDNDSKIEPWGRRLFTAALLISCLCHGECKPVTMDGKSINLVDDFHYIFAEEFLMPEFYIKNETCSSIYDIHRLATRYSVSPAAITMRLFRLNIINELDKDDYLNWLHNDWAKTTLEKGGGNPLGLEKAINRYNNRAVVKTIVDRYSSKDITFREVKNLLCYKKGDSFNIKALQTNA